jgi:hypothetical protein
MVDEGLHVPHEDPLFDDQLKNSPTSILVKFLGVFLPLAEVRAVYRAA